MSNTQPGAPDPIEELRRALIQPDMIVDGISIPKRDDLRRDLVTSEILVERISPHIAEILEEQIVESPDMFARGLAPVMGEAIRRQVYQSREDIIDALYPVIGQMINRAVTEALRDFARSIDAQMRRGGNTSTIRRAAAQLGLSEAEYQMRAALPFGVQEVFLIQRDTGLLISHGSNDDAQSDRDLVSGMLTAIRSFARDAFGRGNEELGSIDYESHRIILEAGSAAYLAVVINGIEPGNFREQLSETLIRLHEHSYDRLRSFDGSDTELIAGASSELTQILQFRQEPPQPAAGKSDKQSLSLAQRFILSLVLLIGLIPLGACGWWFWSIEARLSALGSMSPVVLVATPTQAPTATPQPTSTQVPTATPQPTSTQAPTATPQPTPTPIPGVMTGDVYLRDAPTLEGDHNIELALRGSPVLIIEQSGDWYRVRVRFTTPAERVIEGWMLVQWVQLDPAAGPVPTARSDRP